MKVKFHLKKLSDITDHYIRNVGPSSCTDTISVKDADGIYIARPIRDLLFGGSIIEYITIGDDFYQIDFE